MRATIIFLLSANKDSRYLCTGVEVRLVMLVFSVSTENHGQLMNRLRVQTFIDKLTEQRERKVLSKSSSSSLFFSKPS